MSLKTNSVSSGYSTGVINSNFKKIEEYVNDNLLNRDGVTPGEPNQMEVDLDMNSQDILNVGRIDAKEIGLNGISVKVLLDNTVAEATQEANRAEQEADRAKREADKAEADNISHDAYLLNRANHTGTQPINTVSGLTAALSAKADQTSLDTVVASKVDKVAGKGLSEEDFTTALKDKLDSLAPGPGGIESIVAGSGITVDDSDPVNPIVSATGGGSGGGVESIVAGDGIAVDDGDPANPVISATGSAGAEVNVQTGSAYTLVLTDAFKMVIMDNAVANTLTVPPNTTAEFSANTRIDIGQDGAGQTTVVAGTGVTIRTPETLKLRKQWSKVSLIRRAADVWDIVGDLEAEA